jgi:hypothetical protein
MMHKNEVCFITGGEMREPEDLASALVTVVQSINECKCTDAFFEPLMKAITEMLKDVDD